MNPSHLKRMLGLEVRNLGKSSVTKLVVLPGAYEQAFFGDSPILEGVEPENEGLDGDGDMLSVELSSEDLKRIRAPWVSAWIRKVFGKKNVGYSYLVYKTNLLRKPDGKMDCVDLGNIDIFDFCLNYLRILTESCKRAL